MLASLGPPRNALVMRRLALLCGLALSLTACPRGEPSKRTPAPCTKLGEQCEFEPGKLGACSYKANCDGPNCLYCQSQH